MFEVSKFTEKDSSQWVKLWTAFETGHRTTEESYTVSQKNWPRIMNDPNCYSFALREQKSGLAVGFVLFAVYWCAFTDQDECYISALCVLPKYRKKGGGKLLINKVIQYSEKNNFKRVTWLATEDNKATFLYNTFATSKEWLRYEVKTA